jgi:hypothetical protein
MSRKVNIGTVHQSSTALAHPTSQLPASMSGNYRQSKPNVMMQTTMPSFMPQHTVSSTTMLPLTTAQGASSTASSSILLSTQNSHGKKENASSNYQKLNKQSTMLYLHHHQSHNLINVQ